MSREACNVGALGTPTHRCEVVARAEEVYRDLGLVHYFTEDVVS